MKELHTIEEWSEAIIKAIDSTVNDDVRIFSTKDNSIAFTVSDVATSHLSYKNNVVINDMPLSSCTDIDTKIQLLKSLSTLNTMVGYHNGVIYSCILFLSTITIFNIGLLTFKCLQANLITLSNSLKSISSLT